MTPGAKLTNQIREAASKIGARLFVMTTGKFWQGQIVFTAKKRGGVTKILEEGDIIIRNPRLVSVGFEGLSDLLGGSPVTITPEMVGQTLLVVCAVEVKAGNDKPRPKQPEFVAFIKKAGGRAGFARSIDDALKICRGE